MPRYYGTVSENLAHCPLCGDEVRAIYQGRSIFTDCPRCGKYKCEKRMRIPKFAFELEL